MKQNVSSWVKSKKLRKKYKVMIVTLTPLTNIVELRIFRRMIEETDANGWTEGGQNVKVWTKTVGSIERRLKQTLNRG